MEHSYISNELFHLVGRSNPKDDKANYEVLLKILDAKCVSHPPHKNDWGTTTYTVNLEKSLSNGDLIVPTVTCYADIPFDSLTIHVKKYGRFGLSFLKEFLIGYGVRPVMYLPIGSNDWKAILVNTLLKDIQSVYKGFNELVVSKYSGDNVSYSRHVSREPANEVEAIREMDSIFVKDFLAFVKPFNPYLEQNHQDNFYMEREWRKYGNLQFSPADVQKIIVPNKEYVNRLENERPQYKGKIKPLPVNS